MVTVLSSSIHRLSGRHRHAVEGKAVSARVNHTTVFTILRCLTPIPIQLLSKTNPRQYQMAGFLILEFRSHVWPQSPYLMCGYDDALFARVFVFLSSKDSAFIVFDRAPAKSEESEYFLGHRHLLCPNRAHSSTHPRKQQPLSKARQAQKPKPPATAVAGGFRSKVPAPVIPPRLFQF
jgi:hypothetical protein